MHPFINKMVRHVRHHPPSCLNGFRVTTFGADPRNYSADWSLACSCSATKGQLLGHPLKECKPEYDGPAVFVSPLAFLCSSCSKTTEIIDTKRHGFNSEIGKAEGQSWDSNYRGSGERQYIPCPECGASEFTVTASFGHSHFELIEDQPELEMLAQEYFDSFDCRGKCTVCGKESSLADFELA